MRDDLHGFAEIFAVALLIQNIPVHLSGGQVGIFVQILVDKTLVVTEIEVGLGAVIGDINLAVLKRAHRARIDVDVRIELLSGDLQPAALEQPAERCGRDALAETGYNAAGYKDILGHASTLPSNTVAAGPVRKTASSV